MDDLRFAVVGLGMGMVRAQQVVDTPGAQLVAVADLQPDRRRKAETKWRCRAHDSFDDLLAHADDIDVVYVMTETGNHAKMGMAAARAGKHVISTKPIDITVDRAVEFCRVCDECGITLLVDFQMRYTSALQRARAAMAQGALGRPLFGEVKLKWWRGEDYYEGWHGTWELDGGGSVMNQAVHFVDALTYVLGDVTEVFAYSGVHAHVNCETEDMTNALIRFSNGAEGLIHTTTAYPGRQHDLVEIHGTQGAVGFDLEHLLRWEFQEPAQRAAAWNPQTGAVDGGDAGPYEPELTLPTVPAGAVADMVAVVRDGAEPVGPGWSGIRSVSIIEAIYQSAREGRAVAPRSVLA
ncbi:MAG: Gfo/Idh/MocA family oxidoreductase [Armatimonadetes bacterium]|nr:Gfo/Idh/MocA family oxidoreductase [Armatimonadota bacterium]